MIEILSMVAGCCGCRSCFPLINKFNVAKLAKELDVPEDSILRRHFLTQIRTENASLAAALEKRLAKA